MTFFLTLSNQWEGCGRKPRLMEDIIRGGQSPHRAVVAKMIMIMNNSILIPFYQLKFPRISSCIYFNMTRIGLLSIIILFIFIIFTSHFSRNTCFLVTANFPHFCSALLCLDLLMVCIYVLISLIRVV